MVLLVSDSELEKRLIAKRREFRSDRWDEVWDGVYVMNPIPNNEHQEIVGNLTHALHDAVQDPGLGLVFPGVNLTDRKSGWKKNYRCPDVAVFLKGTKAEDRDTHWYGGPDFAVEIRSPKDRSRKKLGFYAKVGKRELLLVDRAPWALELYRLEAAELKLVGRSTPTDPLVLASEVVPLTWRLVAGDDRPRIEILHRDGN